ncbi:MAG TPA: DCC1-like thiol-disulfide oxidoreductase family protein [Pyrinomonadaceae bacterium]
MTETLTPRAPVLLYDGVCGFCNGAVQTILRHDRRGSLRFAALQSDYGRAALARHPELAGVDSVVFLEASPETGRERVSVRSEAGLRVASYMGGAWKIFLLGRLLPASVRDYLYDLFARHRYKMFGKYDTCLLPPPEVRARFIDASQE